MALTGRESVSVPAGTPPSAGCPWKLSFPDSPPPVPREGEPTRRTGPGPEGRARHLVSGLGATHPETRQRPNFTWSPARLRCPRGTLLESLWRRGNLFLPKRLVYHLVVTEELVRQMSHGHRPVAWNRMETGHVFTGGRGPCRTAHEGRQEVKGSPRLLNTNHLLHVALSLNRGPERRPWGRQEGWRGGKNPGCHVTRGMLVGPPRHTSGTLGVGTQRGGLTGDERGR